MIIQLWCWTMFTCELVYKGYIIIKRKDHISWEELYAYRYAHVLYTYRTGSNLPRNGLRFVV